jgi:hypothetical protein
MGSLEESLRLRKDLGDAAEVALTAARDRILTLEDELGRALGKIKKHEDVEASQKIAAAAAAEADERKKERDAADAEKAREHASIEASRRQQTLVSLENENSEMQKHLQMLTEKVGALDEQLKLSMEEIDIVSKARDDAMHSLSETQAHLEAIKAEMLQEAESRAAAAVTEHLSRQV